MWRAPPGASVDSKTGCSATIRTSKAVGTAPLAYFVSQERTPLRSNRSTSAGFAIMGLASKVQGYVPPGGQQAGSAPQGQQSFGGAPPQQQQSMGGQGGAPPQLQSSQSFYPQLGGQGAGPPQQPTSPYPSIQGGQGASFNASSTGGSSYSQAPPQVGLAGPVTRTDAGPSVRPAKRSEISWVQVQLVQAVRVAPSGMCSCACMHEMPCRQCTAHTALRREAALGPALCFAQHAMTCLEPHSLRPQHLCLQRLL